MALFWQLIFNGLVAGALYAVVAVGFALIFGATHHFHIAHAAVIDVAAYFTYALTQRAHIPTFPAILLAILAAVAVGVGILLCVYVPLEKLQRGDRQTIFLAALGMLILIENGFTLWLSPSNLQATFLNGLKSPVHFGSASLTQAQVGLIVLTAALFAAVMLLLRYTRLGQEIRALANNPDLVQILGRSPNRIKATTYAVASLLAAVAGIYQVGDTGISPGIGTNLVMLAFVAMVAGTVGSVSGAFIAAMALGLFQNIVQYWISAEWSTPVVFVGFLVLIVVVPGGLASLTTGRRKSFTKVPGGPAGGASAQADENGPNVALSTVGAEQGGGAA